MRFRTIVLLSVLAATGIAACGEKVEKCYTFHSTCTASCLDGSTPQFTAESDYCTSSPGPSVDPRDWFCQPSINGPSEASQLCPSQATTPGGASDCTTCTAWAVSSQCGCPDYHW
jgi:hypothetical protein